MLTLWLIHIKTFIIFPQVLFSNYIFCSNSHKNFTRKFILQKYHLYFNKELKILNIHAPLFWRQKMVEDGSCLDQLSPTKKLSFWISLPKLPYSPSINLPHSLHSWWINRPINEKLCINLMIIDDNFPPVNIYPRIPRVYSLLIPIIAFHIITNLIKFMWVLS